MAEIPIQALQSVRDKETLFAFLRDQLHWPLDPEDTFTYDDTQLRGGDAKVSRLVPFGANDPFLIMLVEFEAGFRRSDLRDILRAIRAKMRTLGNYADKAVEDIVFVCVDKDYLAVPFAHFREQEGRQPKLSVFGWEADRANETRTLRELNLPGLEMPPKNVLNEWDWEEGRKRWLDSWNVEQVTAAFYREYERVFGLAEEAVTGIAGDDRRMFTQKLFNRLLFIRFLEKKGWLQFDGRGDYLHALWDDYQTKKTPESNFYSGRLSLLFFSGLNNSQQENLMSINGGGCLKDIIGDVPYLNGGLFDEEEDKTQKAIYPNIEVLDKAIEPVISGLFYAFNFTVTESTPDDVEVAVDPEMLGKVFEELVTKRDRRAAGSYYTPRSVVAFMCRETLKGYLGGYERLVDDHDDTGVDVRTARELLGKLEHLKVVDPACGSGAYLLGMLHEVHALMRILDTTAQRETPRDDYRRKLAIIQDNIYGVDKDEFAVNIARLRLWLSLAVEHYDAQPEPLPNLEFKIETGDSLTAPNPSAPHGLFRDRLVREADSIARLKSEYADPYQNCDKPALKREIQSRIEDLSNFAAESDAPCPADALDWRVQFAEVFRDGGFDIVLANPPYGASVDDDVRDIYFDRKIEGSQSKDTYGLFMARALQLMRQGGQFSYIVSDTWRTIRTHRPLRKRLVQSTTVKHVLDLPSWIFAATVNTCILTLEKAAPAAEHTLIAGDLRAIPVNEWASLQQNLRAIGGHGADCQTLAYARYTYPQSAIAADHNMPFFIGSPRLYRMFTDTRLAALDAVADVRQGLATADNDFYIRSSPGTRGNYEVLNADQLLHPNEKASLTESEKLNGIAPSTYYGRHFVPYDKGGESQADGGWLPNYFVPTAYFIDWSVSSVSRLKTATIADVKRRKGEQSNIRTSDEVTRAAVIRNPGYYFREGLTFSRSGFYAPTFRLNSGSVFDSDGSCIFTDTWSLRVLLGLLSSLVVRYAIKCLIDHTVHAQVEDIKEVRLASPDEHQAHRLGELVGAIIEHQQLDGRYPYYLHEQKDIDIVVYELYGLNSEDIREVELWYCRRYALLAEAQGLLAEVNEKYADHLARCERILSMPPGYWKSNPILELIARGEGPNLEFKETLEWDVRQSRQNRDLLDSALKTIAAFLNTDGGTLLIGVSDSGEINGLDKDYRLCNNHNWDGFEQKIRNLLNSRLTPAPLAKISVEREELPDGTVCRIDVQAAAGVTHMDRTLVYIRDGNGTRRLEGQDLVRWIEQRAH